MAATIDIYCLETMEKFDLSVIILNVENPFAIAVKNISDMVTKVVLACNNAGKEIGELNLDGHGDPFGQYIGSDWLSEESLPRHRSNLLRLAPLFGKGGLLTMRGCEQGQNGHFLLAISDLLNVPVRGFTALQRPIVPGAQGSETRCFITCARGEKDFFDKTDKWTK
jgi:hypothetical protein